jgi:hypothetical protein
MASEFTVIDLFGGRIEIRCILSEIWVCIDEPVGDRSEVLLLEPQRSEFINRIKALDSLPDGGGE